MYSLASGDGTSNNRRRLRLSVIESVPYYRLLDRWFSRPLRRLVLLSTAAQFGVDQLPLHLIEHLSLVFSGDDPMGPRRFRAAQVEVLPRRANDNPILVIIPVGTISVNGRIAVHAYLAIHREHFL